ncbi:MAG: hypothetical protein U0031_00200 [Thermomicrobiales bacterium]
MQTIDPKGSFLKNLVLSVLLLGLSNLFIPLVGKQIDDRKAVDQQRFQDELSRQDTILDPQAALRDTMAADFWTYEFHASDVILSRDERFGQDDWHSRGRYLLPDIRPAAKNDARRDQHPPPFGATIDLRRVSDVLRARRGATGLLPAGVDEDRGQFFREFATGTLHSESGERRRGPPGIPWRIVW